MFDLVPMYFAHASAIVFVAAMFVLMLRLVIYCDNRLFKRKVKTEEVKTEAPAKPAKLRLPTHPAERQKANYLQIVYPDVFADRKQALVAAFIYYHDYVALQGSDLDAAKAEADIVEFFRQMQEKSNG